MKQNLEELRDEQLLALLAVGAKAFEAAVASGNTELANSRVQSDRPLVREMVRRGLTPEGLPEDAA